MKRATEYLVLYSSEKLLWITMGLPTSTLCVG